MARKYIVFFYDRRHNECKQVVTAVNRRQAIRKIRRKYSRYIMSVINAVEA